MRKRQPTHVILTYAGGDKFIIHADEIDTVERSNDMGCNARLRCSGAEGRYWKSVKETVEQVYDKIIGIDHDLNVKDPQS